jgi:Uma2 family endonuclease
MSPAIVEPEIVYPDSDGQPMADNTLQWEWIVIVKENLEILYADDPDVFVAGDNLIYPVEGKPAICAAPDVYVAFGRPKGHRGSYKVWKEDGIFPQVVFEVLSPNNTKDEMSRKRTFYEKYGADEFYVLDPERITLAGYIRGTRGLVAVPKMDGFTSPKLGISFHLLPDDIEVRFPAGDRFLTMVEFSREAAKRLSRAEFRAEQAALRAEKETQLAEQEKQRADEAARRAEQEKQRAEQEKQRAEQEKQRAEQEKQRAEQEKQRAEQEKQRAEQLAAKLRSLGIDPDAP